MFVYFLTNSVHIKNFFNISDSYELLMIVATTLNKNVYMQIILNLKMESFCIFGEYTMFI